MWFAKRKAAPIRSLVGEGTVLHGNLGFADGVRIDGEVHGDVVATTAASLLVISEKARVHGEVKAGACDHQR
jgi:cytoskeletal protein CcmA (bactofilin family)